MRHFKRINSPSEQSPSSINGGRRRVSNESGSSRSTPSQFMSYHAVRQQDQKPAQKRNTETQVIQNSASNKKHSFKLPLHIVAVIIVLLAVGYNLTLVSQPRITITNPSGVVSLRSKTEYQQIITNKLTESILAKTKITLDTQALSKDILKTCPELKSAQVVLPFMGRRPIIEITSRRPALLLQSNGQKFVIDDTGRAIMDLNTVTSEQRSALSGPLVVDKTNTPQRVGDNSLTANDVKFITNVVELLVQKDLRVISLELPPLASELHVGIEGVGYYIKFNTLTDPRIAAGQYIALRNQLERNKEQPTEYVDSRVEGKIFYK